MVDEIGSADPRDFWSLLSGIARDACRADEGGAVARPVRRAIDAGERGVVLDPRVGQAIARQLRSFPACARWTDHEAGTYYAAAALEANPSVGFIWVRRKEVEFDWPEVLRLREFGALATSLHALERALAESELLRQLHQRQTLRDPQPVERLGSTPVARSDHIGRLGTPGCVRRPGANDVFSLIREKCEALGGQIDERGIAIHLSVEGRAGPMAERSCDVLLMAVDELVTNAIKHAFPGDGGTIAVAVECDQDVVRVKVQDDGMPISPADMAQPGRGLDLVARLMAGTRGKLIMPQTEAKTFMIELPVGDSDAVEFRGEFSSLGR
jgi:hypothetical protein